MPESVQDRCTKAHEYIFLLSKSHKYHYDHEAIKEEAISAGIIGGSFQGRQGGAEYHTQSGGVGSEAKEYLNKNKRSVWTIPVKPYEGAHFAVFPQDLIEPCILAGAPIGGIVLDPFMGSGTTAQVAQHLGRQYLGCELNPEYKPLQEKRLRQMSLVLE
jgi:DNA modification methylase